jgi:hypothetical protein
MYWRWHLDYRLRRLRWWTFQRCWDCGRVYRVAGRKIGKHDGCLPF